MFISQTLQVAIAWLAWSGLGLAIVTIIFFIFNWPGKFRLVGATIFTLLLSLSCWAFVESYRPPFKVEGAKYAPVVYDNGFDLVVAQAPKGFPEEAIEPTLQQIAGNLQGGGPKRSLVHVRIRKLKKIEEGLSKPIILGEVIRDVQKNITLPLQNTILFHEESIDISKSNTSLVEGINEEEESLGIKENTIPLNESINENGALIKVKESETSLYENIREREEPLNIEESEGSFNESVNEKTES